jgi:hypothetical protein
VIWCGRDLCCLIAPVNSREKGEHPSYSRAAHVSAGGRNRSPRTSTRQLAASSAVRVCWRRRWAKRSVPTILAGTR